MKTYANALTLATGLSLLFLGGMLYVLYRPTTLLFFRVADDMGLMATIDDWRTAASAFAPSSFVVYSLPAGLWSMSYVLIEHVLMQRQPVLRRWVAVAFVPLLGAASELLQAFHLLRGTFDIADFILYLLPLALYTIIHLRDLPIYSPEASPATYLK